MTFSVISSEPERVPRNARPAKGLSPFCALGTIGIVLGSSAIVARRNSPNPTHPRIRLWYKRLDKLESSRRPMRCGRCSRMASLFGGYRLLRLPPSPPRNAAVGLWLVTTAMVGGWTQLFFGEKRLAASAIAAGAMLATGVAYIAVADRVDRPAVTAAVPLVAWLGFATLLTERVWQRNLPRRRGTT